MSQAIKKIIDDMSAEGYEKFVVVGIKKTDGEESYQAGRGHNLTDAKELLAAREIIEELVQNQCPAN